MVAGPYGAPLATSPRNGIVRVRAAARHSRGRAALLRRILPLFRPQRWFPLSALNLQAFRPREARRRRPVWRNPLFLPLLPANPAVRAIRLKFIPL